MLGLDTWIDKSMNGIKTVSDGFATIQNGKINALNINSSNVVADSGDFKVFTIGDLTTNTIKCNDLQLLNITTNEFLTLDNINTNKTIQSQFNDITTDINTNIKPVITNNATQITNIENDINTNVKPAIATNTTNITDVKTDINTNIKPAIATNTADITNIKNDINTNIKPVIATHTTDITNIKNDINTNIKPAIATNTTNISTNTTNISNIQTDINTNIKPAIATNTTNISNIQTIITNIQNDSSVDDNITDIKLDIATNIKPDIASNTTEITNIKNDINTNVKPAIATNANNLSSLTNSYNAFVASTNTHFTNIDTDISGNIKPAIATNANNLSTHITNYNAFVNSTNTHFNNIDTDISGNIKPAIATNANNLSSLTNSYNAFVASTNTHFNTVETDYFKLTDNETVSGNNTFTGSNSFTGTNTFYGTTYIDSINAGSFINSMFLKANGTNNLHNQSLLQGAYFSWNTTAGTGETDFINSKGLGSGGFNFYNNTSGTANGSSLIASINGSGLLNCSAVSTSGAINASTLNCTNINVSNKLTTYETKTNVLSATGGYIQSLNTSGFQVSDGGPFQCNDIRFYNNKVNSNSSAGKVDITYKEDFFNQYYVYEITVESQFHKVITVSIPISIKRRFNSTTGGLTLSLTDTINNLSYYIYKNDDNVLFTSGNCSFLERNYVSFITNTVENDREYEMFVSNVILSFTPAIGFTNDTYKIYFSGSASITATNNVNTVEYFIYANTDVSHYTTTFGSPVYGSNYSSSNFSVKSVSNNYSSSGEIVACDVACNTFTSVNTTSDNIYNNNLYVNNINSNNGTTPINVNSNIQIPYNLNIMRREVMAAYIVRRADFMFLYNVFCSCWYTAYADADSYWIVMPGYKIITYDGKNYTTQLNEFDNTTSYVPNLFVSQIRAGSFKVYYLGTEITFPYISPINGTA